MIIQTKLKQYNRKFALITKNMDTLDWFKT